MKTIKTKKHLWILLFATMLTGYPAYGEDAKQNPLQTGTQMQDQGVQAVDLNLSQLRGLVA